MKRGTMMLLGGLALGGGVFWWLNRKKVQAKQVPILRPDRIISPEELSNAGSPTPMDAMNMLSQRAVQLDDARQVARKVGNGDLEVAIDAEQQQVASDLDAMAQQVVAEAVQAVTPAVTPPQGPFNMPAVIRPAEPVAPSPAALAAQPTTMTTAEREPESRAVPLSTPAPPSPPNPPATQQAIVPADGVFTLFYEPSPVYSLSRQFPEVAQPIITYVSSLFKLPQGGSWTLEGVYTKEAGYGEGPLNQVFVHWVNSNSNASSWFMVPYNVKADLDAQEARRMAKDAAEAAPQRSQEQVFETQAVRTMAPSTSTAMTTQAVPTMATVSSAGRQVAL